MCFLACRHRNSDCTGLSKSVCAVIYHWITWNDSAVKLGHFLFRWIWFHMKGSSSTQDMSRSTISIVLVKCMYSSYLFFIFFKESDWRFKRGSDQILYLQCKQLSRLAAKHHTVRSRWQSLYTSLFSEQRHIFTATKLFSIKHASAHIQCKHPPPPPLAFSRDSRRHLLLSPRLEEREKSLTRSSVPRGEWRGFCSVSALCWSFG